MSIYNRIYVNLCEGRRNRKSEHGPGSGLHCHHIVPRHSGGTDDESNLTYLTVREHIIAHFLLWKINGDENDLRSMYMLGANITSEQRIAMGKFCRDNEIGFFNEKWKDLRKEWRERGLQTQKVMNSKKTFYYWSTEEGYREYCSLGGKASLLSPDSKNHKWKYWMSNEGQKERASMGGKSHKGKKTMYKPGDKTFIRVSPEDFEERLDQGYIFGSPFKPNKRNPAGRLMYKPGDKKSRLVPKENIDSMLSQGYIFGRL